MRAPWAKRRALTRRQRHFTERNSQLQPLAFRLYPLKRSDMKMTLLSLLALFTCVGLNAADDPALAAVRAADDARVAATMAADRAKLSSVFSDDLRYAHSTGHVDTKTSYMESLVSGRTKYHVIEFEERNFTFPAPGIALESGRAHMKSTSATGESDALYSFLAVWRQEKGQWRFLAWQSCKLPPTVPAAKPK
jgi:hypothetical protein